jgi:hypothetical protein
LRIDANNPAEFLAALPDDRRETVSAVRDEILSRLPDGYVEEIRSGMISYEIPLDRHPDTYNGKPLAYAALASQKQHNSLYLMGVYCDPDTRTWFEAAAAERGVKLDMGKACVRFRRVEDLPLDLVGQAIARLPVDDYIRIHQESRAGG